MTAGRSIRATLAVVALLAGLLVLDLRTARPAAAWPASTVDLLGHGWGHGRGMGQYGSLGDAVNQGWNYHQILEHYYPNTTAGSLPGGTNVQVELTAFDGIDTIVLQEKGAMSTNAAPGTFTALRARRIGSNLFAVDKADKCDGGTTGWQNINPSMPGPVTFGAVNSPPADHSDMLQTCHASGNRWYRGSIDARDKSGTQITVNTVSMEDYLRGVVPRESPASWGDLTNGMASLRAQAVAARSYAWAENRLGGEGTTCDSTACQVYGGVALQQGTTFTALEDSRTDAAVSETAGETRMLNGATARTEFSSSTGGYTAGGTFPSVVDDGDDICLANSACNPNHKWTASVPVAAIETKYNLGTLDDIQILKRNGLGEEGGRVLSMRLVFANGNADITGDDFRSSFGLKSNWFTVTNKPSFPYHVVTADGGVFSFGGAAFHGSLPGIKVKTATKDISEGPGGGYWLLGADGGVFSFDEQFYGSMGGQHLNKPVVGMTTSPTGKGYWLVATDGGLFSFGDAAFYGSTGNMRLNQPVVGMSPTPAGQGYWMVATDGGIFSFGDAGFHGSTGNIKLNQPVFAMAASPTGSGYWLVAKDGGIFTFGDASYQGSLPSRGIKETAVEMLPSDTGYGYLIVTAEGNVYSFGDAIGAGGPKQYNASAPSVGAGHALP